MTDFDVASSREWLETNGIGGFASGTVSGAHTRRYHGLLTAATDPPTGRAVLLSKLAETVIGDDGTWELDANRYPGIVHPNGFRHLREFRAEPFPTFIYEAGGREVRKEIGMLHGRNAVVVRYRISGRPAGVILRPLIAFRDYHALTHENGEIDGTLTESPGGVSIAPYPGLPRLYFAWAGGRLEPDGCWYRRFQYALEQERGLEFEEDLYNPFALRFAVPDGGTISLVASTEPLDASAWALLEGEARRRIALTKDGPADDPLARRLFRAADAYVVDRGTGKTLIAGYHWFTDWGRDTMIALPGLTLVNGRHDVARSILGEFARHVDGGMLPNRFPDAGGSPEYNTIDATLWYFEAIRAYLRYAGPDPEFLTRIYPVLSDIIDWHVRGTRYGIRVDADGLITSDPEGAQLTWMDARIGDWVVTPRHGKAVEIQALWYNALQVTSRVAFGLGDASRGSTLARMADEACDSFNRAFWNAERECLYDRVAPDGPDPTLRPNQILAVSLHHSMLDGERARKVVRAVREHLFTPVGLRSLDPRDPGYRGRYEGDAVSRDSAYHQGPVWPWLLGPFITAWIRVHPDAQRARAEARSWLDGFAAHLDEGCVGQVSEIFDGDAPHAPRGCVAQAWSVGELLRALVEDVRGERPSDPEPAGVSARGA